jgi:hypothetical protein
MTISEMIKWTGHVKRKPLEADDVSGQKYGSTVINPAFRNENVEKILSK